MKHLLELENKLSNMTTDEIYNYAKENYPEEPNMWMGKKKLVVRRIVNYERNKMNSAETTE
ncbi:hypothetical protein J7W08_11050 [Methanococcoides orientis]|jgi:hypothetical protein|uniref:hypothetical protein n=1 Tax=Methanococcoides orientis TaxID=2822137 RepID=UPI001E5BEBAF|nr:hypothetical protein [Methanococcoides orientis]UGV40579.1 hypothetical protein J7W08_11050 [Methanococcoides orientis]